MKVSTVLIILLVFSCIAITSTATIMLPSIQQAHIFEQGATYTLALAGNWYHTNDPGSGGGGGGVIQK